MTDRDVPSPKLDLAVQRTAAVQHRVMWLRTRRTTHVWPQTPKTLLIQEALFMELDRRWSWGQASRSAVKWCLLGEGSETHSFTPPSTTPQNVTCELNHRGQRLTQNTACSNPWRMEAVVRHEQHTTMLSFTAVLEVIQIRKNIFCLTRHLFSREVQKTKTSIGRAEILSEACAYAVFPVKPHIELLFLIFNKHFFLCLA